MAAQEFPYRPAANLQFWYADVAYIPVEDWQGMRSDTYPIYAPPLVIEVLSPSNEPAKIGQEGIAAFSGGTREFWRVDLHARTIEVSFPDSSSRLYREGEHVPVSALPGALFAVSTLFEP